MISPQLGLTLFCLLVFLKSGWNDVVHETSGNLSGTEEDLILHPVTSRSSDNDSEVADVTTVTETGTEVGGDQLTSVTDKLHRETTELHHSTHPVPDKEHYNISVKDDLVVSEFNIKDCNPNYTDQAVQEQLKAHESFPGNSEDDSLIIPVYELPSSRNNCMKALDWKSKPSDDEDFFAGSGFGSDSDITEEDLTFTSRGRNDVVHNETSENLSETEEDLMLHPVTSRSSDNGSEGADSDNSETEVGGDQLTSETDHKETSELHHSTHPVPDKEHYNISVKDDLVVSEFNIKDCNPNYADQAVQEQCKKAHESFADNTEDDSLIIPVYVPSSRNNCMKALDWKNKPSDDEDCFAGSGSGSDSKITEDDLTFTSRESTWTYESAEMSAGVTEEDRIWASTDVYLTRGDEMKEDEFETTTVEATRLYKVEQTSSSSDMMITNYVTGRIDSSTSDTTTMKKHTSEHPQVPPYPDYHPSLDSEDDSMTLVLVVSISTGIVIAIILAIFFTLKCRSRRISRVNKPEENKPFSACTSQQSEHIDQCTTPLPNANENIKNRNDKSKKRDIKECYV